jgi:hypothetical protein
MLTDKERGTVIFALEEYANILEMQESYEARNSVLELIWKLDSVKGEGEGECDKCNSPYDITSTDNRCGNCGNCSNCCTHKGDGE